MPFIPPSPSSPPTPKEETPPITGEDFARFALYKKLNPGCPVCATTTWSVINAPDSMEWTLSSALRDGNMRIPPPTLPFVVLVCENCYFSRIHAYVPLRSWLDSNKAQAES